MSAVDWNRLAPHLPAENQYRPRRDSLSVRLAQRLSVRPSSVAVIGPAGIGKSTEMGALMALLGEQGRPYVGYLLDHNSSELRQLHAALPATLSVFQWVVALLDTHMRSRLSYSETLTQRLAWLNAPHPDVPHSRYADALNDLLTEHRAHRPVILLDGLDRQDDLAISSTLEALAPFSGSLDLVAVLPPRWAVQGSKTMLSQEFLVESVRPAAVRAEHDASWREGLGEMTAMLLAHLGLSTLEPTEAAIVRRAAEASGGVPRVFLQLLLDASFYASVAKRTWPNEDDLRQAMRDQVSALRRILMPGDLEALQRARGTDGLEIEPERRIRFLSHGLLLEYGQAEDIKVFPTPLLEGLLALRSAA